MICERVNDPDADPALMTWPEYFQYKNPDNKTHSAESYDWDLEQMNNKFIPRELARIDRVKFNADGYKLHEYEGQIRVTKDWDTVGFSRGNVYYTTPNDFGSTVQSMVGTVLGNDFKVQKVKYLDELIKEMYTEELRAEYSEIIQNIRSKGEQFQIRKSTYDKHHDAYAIFNKDGIKVSIAQDEWGAVLLVTAKEYRGYGFGEILGKLYTEAEPRKGSGGTTAMGKQAIYRRWEAFVREALQHGVYTKLYREGKITRDRIKEIMSGLSDRRKRKDRPDATDYAGDHKNWLVMNNESSFVIYHQDLYEQPDNASLEDLEKYIMAYALVRDMHQNIYHLYRVDYTNELSKNMIVLAALTEFPDMHVDVEAADFVDDINNIPKTEIVDGVMKMTDDRVPGAMRGLFSVEEKYRAQHDKYGQYHSLILETAEYKW